MPTDPYIKGNILHQPIFKGLDFVLNLGSPDLDLTQYTDIRAEFKASRALGAPALIRLDLDGGITITADTLILTIPWSQTAKIKYPVLYMDIKAVVGTGSPVLLLQSEHKILETTTEL